MNLVLERISPEDIPVDFREIWARLGGIGSVSEEKIRAVIAEIGAEASPAFLADDISVRVNNGICISADELMIASADFAKIAGGCSRVMMIAATLGAGVDRLIHKKSALSVAEGFIFDAVASAMAEGLVDLAEIRSTSGYEHTKRFSPGYGDMPLSLQGEIIRLLDGRRLGITLSESGMMIPRKTVTALIGMK